MKKLIAYRCDYCKKYFALERNARKHEEMYCFRSPLARTCFTCSKWEVEEGSSFGTKYCNEGLDLEDPDNDSYRVRKRCADYEPRG